MSKIQAEFAPLVQNKNRKTLLLKFLFILSSSRAHLCIPLFIPVKQLKAHQSLWQPVSYLNQLRNIFPRPGSIKSSVAVTIRTTNSSASSPPAPLTTWTAHDTKCTTARMRCSPTVYTSQVCFLPLVHILLLVAATSCHPLHDKNSC